MTAWLSLAISIVAIAVSLIVMRRMIDRRAGSATVMEEIRREVGAILTEMNQTTERNIELVEDKVKHLQETIELADKRMGALRRESERQEHAAKVYTHLSRVPRPSTPPDANPRHSAPISGSEQESTSENQSAVAAAVRTPSAAAEEAAPVPNASGRDAVEPEASAGDIEPELTMKERVLGLYRQGISVERIASRVGTAVSEIELIVSLGER